MRAISASNEMPAASAASGSSDVPVSPGIAFASSTESSPCGVEHQVDAREARAPERRVDGERERLRPRGRVGPELGRAHEARAADLVARLEVVEDLLVRDASTTGSASGPSGPSSTDTARSRPSTWRSSSTFVS